MKAAPELAALIASAAQKKAMHARMDIDEPGWTFWERRTLNIHRVVGVFRAMRPVASIPELDAELRGVLARQFKRAWWRGIAYGVVANVGPIAFAPKDLEALVDAYENSRGTMQWVVLVNADTREATGVHTWVEGFLSPMYRSVLQGLADRSYKIASVRKEKDGLLKFLTSVADGKAMAQTGHRAFSEFRDDFPAAGTGAARSPQTRRP